MTLIEFIAEQRAIGEGLHSIGWTRDSNYAKMLNVLGCFQKGDCKRLTSLEDFLREYCTDIRPIEKETLDMLLRLAKAAHIMEADDHA
jgi:hypothetical protein